MKYEVSAGGVIVYHSPRILYILLLKDRKGSWTFPKGLIENREKLEDTAQREIAEEVGIRKLKYIMQLTSVEYMYRWEGSLRKKTVHYFLFEVPRKVKATPQREEGILEARWFSFEKAVELIGYPKTNLRILKEVEKYEWRHREEAKKAF